MARGVCMAGASMKCAPSGENRSALDVAPFASMPPANSTRPFGSSVPVAPARTLARSPAGAQKLLWCLRDVSVEKQASDGQNEDERGKSSL